MNKIINNIIDFITGAGRNPKLKRCPKCLHFMEIWHYRDDKSIFMCPVCHYEDDIE